MLKKIAITAAAVLALGTAAQAAPPTTNLVEVNIYGASAQYTFWNATSETFLQSQMGCTGEVDHAEGNDANGTKKHGISWGYNCSAVGGDNIIIRYSSKASYDGIYSVLGEASVDPAENCPAYQRYMADNETVSGEEVTSLECTEVTVGASDVAGEAFTQKSEGYLDGHDQSEAYVYPEFTGIDTSSLEKRNPVVVPFAPFLNTSVKRMTCDAGANAGEACTSTDDCAGEACSAKTLESVSREMLVNLFSGKIKYWSDFGEEFPTTGVTLCMRHAGSGTHATLDHAVMNKKWGANLVTKQQNIPVLPLKIWFYESSSDLVKAVNATAGAIGYADADKVVGKEASYPNMYRAKYNGFTANRKNIRNGLYDFWAAQHLYFDAANVTGKPLQVVEALNTFASNAAMLDTVPIKSDYWASQGEMEFFKNNDFQYPTKQ